MDSHGPAPIQFGTAGWRAAIARDFTFHGVRLAAQAVAEHLKNELGDTNSPVHAGTPAGRDERDKRDERDASNNSPIHAGSQRVILAHDGRFLGPQFALAAAEVLAAAGFCPLLCNGATPAPALALAIRKHKAAGGINLAAGHNPPEHSGFTFSRRDGAGALPDVTRPMEAAILRLERENWRFPAVVIGTFQAGTLDPRPDYFQQIEELVDFDAIKKARLKIAVDLMCGCGRGYLDTLLLKAGAKLTVLHNESDAFFGGHPPDPGAEHLAQLRQAVGRSQAQLGLATGGDAGRFGVVDRDGSCLAPNQILALALYYLKKNRGWTGSVVRTVTTSHLVDAVARLLGVQVRETPVGFKYIGALMETEPVIVGGEESGGLSVRGHVPEKDGILACLLMAELVAAERKSLGVILAELARQTGPFYTGRINLSASPEQKESLQARLAGGLETVGKFPVKQLLTSDGCKFLLPREEWVAFRAGGTEPVVRCHIEARSQAHFIALRAACRAILRP
jgi:phosphomannomutase